MQMVLKFHDWRGWENIKLGGGIVVFPGLNSHQRTLRFEVNCPEPTRVDLVLERDGKGNPTKVVFLAAIVGREVIEVGGVEGDVAISFDTDGDVWLYTKDGGQYHVRSDLPSFTRPANRKARDRNLEAMEARILANVGRRMAAVERDNALLARENARLAALNAGADPETGEVVDGGQVDSGAGPSGAADHKAASGTASGAKPKKPEAVASVEDQGGDGSAGANP